VRKELHMKKLQYLFTTLALILSHLMCILTAYDYSAMLCAIEHAGTSAPASVVLLETIPFMAGIFICLGLAYFFRTKTKRT